MALIVILTGCGRVAQNVDNSKSSTSPDVSSAQFEAGKQRVRVTAQGFEPKTITVKRGSTITWINEDNQTHWIASDPYPVHTNLATFDSGRALAHSETFELTFNRIGEWSYHDHLRPVTYNGLVMVTE